MKDTLPDRFKTIFPYDQPRKSQVDGIQTIDNAISSEGIVTMEGACGTGKTLTALTPAIHQIRNKDSKLEKVVAVTSVKQQMTAFQEEVKRINESLSDGVRPISALTLVSVSDLHPYVREGVIDEGYDQINSLREGARQLATEEIHEYDFSDLYQQARVENSDEMPYGYRVPEANGIEYDPYYAKYRSEYDSEEDNANEVIPFDIEYSGMMSVEDLSDMAGSQGYCPHSIMRLAVEHVDLIIGNYTHVFDPMTVERVSSPVLNEKTVAIFDEAHNLVERVRGFLSDQIPITSISRSREEIEELLFLLELYSMNSKDIESIQRSAGKENQTLSDKKEDMNSRLRSILSNSSSVLTGDKELRELSKSAHEIAKRADVSANDLERYMTFLDELESVLSDLIKDEMPVSSGESIRLREPQEPGKDKISEWISLNRYGGIAKQAETIGTVSKAFRETVTNPSEKVQTSSNKTGKLLTDWNRKDNTRYYRSIEIKSREKASGYGTRDWQRRLKAELTINNCIPRNEIAQTLDTFHSSILMSATLEPMDVYRQTTGISDLEDEGTPVYNARYGLAFPEENRVTLGVPAEKFKNKFRGSAFDTNGANTDNETRNQYIDVVFDVVQKTDGNVMIVMPSYTEAEWIGSILESSYLTDSDEVFIDQSSSNRETKELKSAFYNADQGILVTGARGTLIEGVDYIGDRLKAVVVCGVPIINTQSDHKKAIQAAYDKIFEDTSGFDLAFTIPAVWKARQAIGRVVRTSDDVGARILVDKRYVDNKEFKKNVWDSVHQYLSPDEQSEMEFIPPEDVDLRLDAFWDIHGNG